MPLRTAIATITGLVALLASAAFALGVGIGTDAVGWMVVAIIGLPLILLCLLAGRRMAAGSLGSRLRKANRHGGLDVPVRSASRTIRGVLVYALPTTLLCVGPLVVFLLLLYHRHHDAGELSYLVLLMGVLALGWAVMAFEQWRWLGDYEEAEGVRVLSDTGARVPGRGLHLVPSGTPARAPGSMVANPQTAEQAMLPALKWGSLAMAAFTVGEAPLALAAAVSSSALRVLLLAVFIAYWAVIVAVLVQRRRHSTA